MSLLWKYFLLGFSALLPLINPLGSALVFLGLVGLAPIKVYRSLARKIAINTIIFFAVIELIGSSLLSFFGISLPIMQVSGGIVISMIALSLLNQKDSAPSPEKTEAALPAVTEHEIEGLKNKAFYPFTFPITAGPGCIVVMLTLTIHAKLPSLPATILAYAGLFLAAVVLSGSIYLCYAYAPKIAQVISPTTAHGMLRVVAFILFCIGVQIAWNGLEALLIPLLHTH